MQCPKTRTSLSRQDPSELLGTYSDHSILLDGALWPTVEHYFQAMQFAKPDDQRRILDAATAQDASRRGRWAWLRGRRGHWKQNTIQSDLDSLIEIMGGSLP